MKQAQRIRGLCHAVAAGLRAGWLFLRWRRVASAICQNEALAELLRSAVAASANGERQMSAELQAEWEMSARVFVAEKFGAKAGRQFFEAASGLPGTERKGSCKVKRPPRRDFATVSGNGPAFGSRED